jgi:hypothetical protein
LGEFLGEPKTDARAARKAIEDSFSSALSRTCYWLDLGNNAASGQYVLGQPLNAGNRRKAGRLRTISELYPEIVDAEAGEDPLPSCSAVEALDQQEPFINPDTCCQRVGHAGTALQVWETEPSWRFLQCENGKNERIACRSGSLVEDAETLQEGPLRPNVSSCDNTGVR